MEEGRAAINSADGSVPQVLDRSVLAALLDDVGLERTKEICDVFIRDARTKVDSLQAALDAGDAATAARVAHGLKSGSGFVGATAISDLGAEIERTARANDLAFARNRMADLREGLAHAADQLAALVGAPKTVREA